MTSSELAGDTGTRPGVIEFYRSLAESVEARFPHLVVAVEVALIAFYFLVRTAGGSNVALGIWLGVSAFVTLVSPASGLVILAAIAPFEEGVFLTRDIGAKPALVLILVLGIALRVAASVAARRSWERPPWSIMIAGAILAGTAFGLGVTRLRFGSDSFNGAWQIWLAGIATALLVFGAAAWVARNGELRPLIVALVSASIAALLSLVDFVAPDAFRASIVGWTAHGPYMASRLTGVIRSPTSTAALIMIPTTVFLAAAVLARQPRLRVAALVTSVPLLVAAYLTYNRAVFLALFALAVVVAWRIRRAFGVALLTVGLIVGVAFIPQYMTLRGQAVGMSVEPGQVLIASDQQRLNAWATAARMFVDSPLLGQGYRSYREVATTFGDTTLNAPHNEWLRLFAEDGIIVGILGLAFIVVTTATLARRRDWLQIGILGAFLSFVLAAAFNNPFLFNQVTIPAFIVAGTGIALSRLPEPAA